MNLLTGASILALAKSIYYVTDIVKADYCKLLQKCNFLSAVIVKEE